MSSRPQLTISIPLVLFGLFRYWYVVESLDHGESPTDALMGDWQLQLTIVLWLSACGYASGLRDPTPELAMKKCVFGWPSDEALYLALSLIFRVSILSL